MPLFSLPYLSVQFLKLTITGYATKFQPCLAEYESTNLVAISGTVLGRKLFPDVDIMADPVVDQYLFKLLNYKANFYANALFQFFGHLPP